MTDPHALSLPNRPNGSAERAPAEVFDAIVSSVRSVLHAEVWTVQLAVGCLVAGGHLLVEDHPGLGKTTLAKALARTLGLDVRRIQCTADLLPADIIGAMVLERDSGEPVFRRGPVFTNVLMADELNRASARTQSALLETMEERQASVDGVTIPLPDPFMVIATQNPYDAAGTSPLPHSQRDRFLVRISLGYPARSAEDAMLAAPDSEGRLRMLRSAVGHGELEALSAAVAGVHVSAAARHYILDLVAATRAHPLIAVGASPRAALALLRAARALAVAAGRPHVSPDDIGAVAGPVLAHRVLLDAGAELTGTDAEALIASILQTVPVPLTAGPGLPVVTT